MFGREHEKIYFNSNINYAGIIFLNLTSFVLNFSLDISLR